MTNCLRRASRTIALTGLALAAAALPAFAEEPDPILAELGEERFAMRCASCHGTTAEGDGPVARVMTVPPADLTRIAERRNCVFPDGEISRYIDGRFEVRGHGSREMPVWGERFSEGRPEPGLGDAIARGQIAVVVEYLKTIQIKDCVVSEETANSD